MMSQWPTFLDAISCYVKNMAWYIFIWLTEENSQSLHLYYIDNVETAYGIIP